MFRIVPEGIAQELRIDIDKIDEINYELMLAKINNYVRNLTSRNASMDIGSLDNSKQQEGTNASNEENNQEDGQDQQ
eukprot:4812048-Karenia_brevis.AAC.1